MNNALLNCRASCYRSYFPKLAIIYLFLCVNYAADCKRISIKLTSSCKMDIANMQFLVFSFLNLNAIPAHQHVAQQKQAGCNCPISGTCTETKRCWHAALQQSARKQQVPDVHTAPHSRVRFTKHYRRMVDK